MKSSILFHEHFPQCDQYYAFYKESPFWHEPKRNGTADCKTDLAPYSWLFCRSRRFSSRSIPSRITSRRDSSSALTASNRSTVSSVNGRVSLTGHSFFRPTAGAVSDVRNSAKEHLFRMYDIDVAENISYVRYQSKGRSGAMAKKSLNDRMIEAEERGNRYLAEANEAAERGDRAKADRLYEKGQFWLDRYNKLAGNS